MKDATFYLHFKAKGRPGGLFTQRRTASHGLLRPVDQPGLRSTLISFLHIPDLFDQVLPVRSQDATVRDVTGIGSRTRFCGPLQRP